MSDHVNDSLSAAAVQESWVAHARRHTQVRCGVCGSPEVVGVCHHCHKVLCAAHVARPQIHQQRSWEFRDLLPSPFWSKAVHCDEDAHFVFAYRRIIVWPAVIWSLGMFLLLLAIIPALSELISTVFDDPLVYLAWVTWILDTWFRGQPEAVVGALVRTFTPLLLTLVGLTIGVATAVIGEWRYRTVGIPTLEREGQPLTDIPCVPGGYKVDIAEKISVSCEAAEDRLVCTFGRGEGVVRIAALPNRAAAEQAEAYNARARRRHWQLSRVPDWDFGYAAMDLPDSVTWSPSTAVLGHADNLLALRPVDPDTLSEVTQVWSALTFEEPYTLSDQALQPGEAIDRRPFLRVLPVLKPLSAGRTLLFLFDLLPSLADGAWVLTDLTLTVPSGVFEEGSARFPVVETNGYIDHAHLQIHWPRWPLTGVRRELPSVTFTAPVPTLRFPLTATFEIEGDRSIAGLAFADQRIWLPTGAPADATGVLKHTVATVCGDVTIDPALLSYQCELATAPISEALPGVTLTPGLLSVLLQRLAEADVVVHSLNQSTDTISSLDGQRILLWDLWGRHYVDVYPMDVHLQLTNHGTAGNGRGGAFFTLTGRVLVNSQFEAFGYHVQVLAQELAALVRAALSEDRQEG